MLVEKLEEQKNKLPQLIPAAKPSPSEYLWKKTTTKESSGSTCSLILINQPVWIIWKSWIHHACDITHISREKIFCLQDLCGVLKWVRTHVILKTNKRPQCGVDVNKEGESYDKQEMGMNHWKLCDGNANDIRNNLELPEEESKECL